MSFPTKGERAQCWKTRDEYWSCLEKNAPTHNSTSGEEVPSVCLSLRKLFEKSCPNQWVKHFDRKRSYEQFKDRLKEGFDPLDSKS